MTLGQKVDSTFFQSAIFFSVRHALDGMRISESATLNTSILKGCYVDDTLFAAFEITMKLCRCFIEIYITPAMMAVRKMCHKNTCNA